MLAVRATIGPPTPVLLAPVVVDLGVRTARPGRARRPEVVLVPKTPGACFWNAGFLPDLEALVVIVVDPCPQPPRFKPQILGQKLVGKGNGLLLEVVAEREVAQHLEEGEVMAVVANDVDVGRAEHFLDRSGARVG